MKNWKTNLFGGLVLVSQIGGAFGLPPKAVNAVSTLCVSLGLISAKDSNVTGGSVKQ